MGYTDQTSGQTYDFSNDYSSQGAAKLFDDNIATDWLIDYPSVEEWVEVEFSSAQDIVKLRICGATLFSSENSPEAFRFKASNTGAFTGEEVTLLDISGLTWTNNEWKEWIFANGTTYTYYRLYLTRKSSIWISFSESEWMTFEEEVGEVADDLGINDLATSQGGAYLVESPDQLGIDDLASAIGGSQEVNAADQFGINDESIAGGEFQQDAPDAFGINDIVSSYQSIDSVIDALGIADNIQGGLEYQVGLPGEDLGIADLVDALNWSLFLRENIQKYLIKYFCTLTGSPDGLSDVELPMQSFQARKRDGEPTYVSAVIPGMDYLDEISDRPNGQIIIEMAYFVEGVEQLREEILRVDMENIRYDKGSRNRSVTISGHRSESFAVNLVDLENPSYKYLSEGKLRYRFPILDPWLNPGDTCSVQSEGDEFRVDYITYVVSPNLKFMEISEA